MAEEEINTLLSSHQRLSRSKGVDKLKDEAQRNAEPNSLIKSVIMPIILSEDSKTWEPLHGALMVVTAMADVIETGLVYDIIKPCARALEHTESRIRLQAGQALASLCKVHGTTLYKDHCKDIIFAGIKTNLNRGKAEPDENLKAKLGGTKTGMTAEEIFHESAGWKNLETNFTALLEIIRSCGTSFAVYVDDELLDLLYNSLSHANRFVRETSFLVCAELSETIHGSEADTVGFDEKMLTNLQMGLADNWSQVRMAASVATRKFLKSTASSEKTKHFLSQLVPWMALNRYYVAEGVRLYSQQTWMEIVGSDGKQLVEQNIKAIIDYYILQSDAANHAVREAACACIAELGAKVNKDVVREHFPLLLEALIACFQDDSWPVRDAACIACGRFVKCFPDECRDSMEELYTLFFFHVGDNIWSVRENAAIALRSVVEAYGDVAFRKVETWMLENLPKASKQPASQALRLNTNLENTTTFGVADTKKPTKVVQEFNEGGVRRIRYQFGDEDPMHSNQQVFSCGSLAPKLKRKGGCMDCGFHRPQEPWESSDGCIYLMRELAEKKPKRICEMLPTVADICRNRAYPEHVYLLETIWKQLSPIMMRIGKRDFKKHLQPLLEPLHYSLGCERSLLRVAAETYASHLAQFLGPSILRGRVEMEDTTFVDRFNHILG
eukprot:m.70800 g.70800  ORF g.70800 m.70800 type:complete len:669 (+) comp12166_c0_seq1:27-2033(+)